MYNGFKYLITGFLLIPLLAFYIQKQDPFLKKIEELIHNTRKINTLSYRMNRVERFGTDLKTQRSFVKMQTEPFMLYIRQLYPKEGVEVLYLEGKNKDQVLINPNGFPWININLDPYGSIMLKDQHHTIYDSGYNLFLDLMDHLMVSYDEETDSVYYTDTIWSGIPCTKIHLIHKDYDFINYKVKAGENVFDIARKLKINAIKVIEHNKEVDDHFDLNEGQTIQVPNDYAPIITLIVDKEKRIPLVIGVYDDQGLFELYEYHDLKINPVFKPEEFTPDCPGYGF